MWCFSTLNKVKDRLAHVLGILYISLTNTAISRINSHSNLIECVTNNKYSDCKWIFVKIKYNLTLSDTKLNEYLHNMFEADYWIIIVPSLHLPCWLNGH